MLAVDVAQTRPRPLVLRRAVVFHAAAAKETGGQSTGGVRNDTAGKHRAMQSTLSLWSRGSILSIASEGSILSVGSSGSVLSLASVGSLASAFSVGSAGSVASLLSAGSLASALSAGSRARILGRKAGQGQRLAVAGALIGAALGVAFMPARS